MQKLESQQLLPTNNNAIKPFARRIERDFRVLGHKIPYVSAAVDNLSDTMFLEGIVDAITRPKYEIGIIFNAATVRNDFKRQEYSLGVGEFRTRSRAESKAAKIALEKYGVDFKKIQEDAKRVWMWDIT